MVNLLLKMILLILPLNKIVMKKKMIDQKMILNSKIL